MSMAYWPPVRSRPPVVQRDFKGVNKLDPFSLADGYATDLMNLSTTNYPSLTVRPGTSRVGAAIGTNVLGLGVWKDSEIHAVYNGAWSKLSGGGWVPLIGSGLNLNAEWSFANFKGNLPGINLIGANGIDPIKAYDGSTVTSLATAPAGGNYIEQYADRLWAAVGNELRYSAYRMANDWTTVNGDDADSGYMVVETNNGETINAVKSGLSNMTVFKPNSIHKLFGYSASDYTMQTVTQEVGALNNKCVAMVEGIMYILHKGGLYEYSGGTRPDKTFSLPVQYYFDFMNKDAAKQKACLGAVGRKLYVSIPLNHAEPDTVLEYDAIFKTWTVWNYGITQFAKLANDLYFGINGSVNMIGGTTDAGASIPWHWISKPFGSGSLAQRVRWNRLWITATVPTGSTLKVYLSKDAIGENWELAQSVVPTSTLSSTRIMVPTHMAANANYIRIKFEGTGPCEIKEIARDEIPMPLV